MAKIWCCLCFRRTDNRKARKRIGVPSIWSLIELHALKIGLEIAQFSKEDYICAKCYSSVSHYRMNDRGPNKKVKICQPVVLETIINKTVLRGFAPPEIIDSTTSDPGT